MKIFILIFTFFFPFALAYLIKKVELSFFYVFVLIFLFTLLIVNYLNKYNKHPQYSLKKHLFFFNQKKISKKLYIIGSMKELGSNSSNYHIEILDIISSYNLLECIFIGDEFFKLKNMFKNYKFYKSYKDYTKIMNRDLSNFKNIFVMGSRSNQLEKIIEKI